MATEVIIMLTQIAAGTTLLALLWLTARAFKKNTAWGLGILLLSPFTAIAFAIMYWDRERLPFLAYIGTFAITTALMASLFTTWGGWELLQASRNAKQALQTQTLTNADISAFRQASLSFSKQSGINYQDDQLLKRIQHQLGRDAELEEFNAKTRAREAAEAQEAEKTYTLEGLYRRPAKEKERYQLVYKQIKLADARNYIGSTVKITRKNVLEKEYRLTGATRSSLQLAQRNRHGSFSFSFKNRDIEKIRVLTKQPDLVAAD
jgi:hypothetical protein